MASPGWSHDDDLAFQNLLLQFWACADRLDKIASGLPTKSPKEVKQHFAALEREVADIESGRAELPDWGEPSAPAPPKKGKGCGGAADAERRKGVPWSEEEHRLFLLGLAKFGKGDWRSISRTFVVTRTPTQVASHAQKYFIRLNATNKKDKRRSSIHDITTALPPGGDAGGGAPPQQQAQPPSTAGLTVMGQAAHGAPPVPRMMPPMMTQGMPYMQPPQQQQQP